MPFELTAGRAVVAPIAVFVWQVIGASRTFRQVEGERGSPLAAVISLGFVALIVNTGLEPVNAGLFGIAYVGLAAALMLFEWARRTVRDRYFSWVFSRDTPSFLCTDGPFAYVRNPFYTSYLLTMGAVVVMLPGVFRGAVFIGMVAYFTSAAVHEERKFERSPLAADYARYKQRTGRFLPKISAARR
jgi:protein-S-isoprenylcysteine O-methyltransferase Ste14